MFYQNYDYWNLWPVLGVTSFSSSDQAKGTSSTTPYFKDKVDGWMDDFFSEYKHM